MFSCGLFERQNWQRPKDSLTGKEKRRRRKKKPNSTVKSIEGTIILCKLYILKVNTSECYK